MVVGRVAVGAGGVGRCEPTSTACGFADAGLAGDDQVDVIPQLRCVAQPLLEPQRAFVGDDGGVADGSWWAAAAHTVMSHDHSPLVGGSVAPQTHRHPGGWSGARTQRWAPIRVMTWPRSWLRMRCPGHVWSQRVVVVAVTGPPPRAGRAAGRRRRTAGTSWPPALARDGRAGWPGRRQCRSGR